MDIPLTKKGRTAARPFSRCHSERLTPVSFRTDVRNPQLRDAFGMDDLDDLDDLGAAGDGAKLEEIPRRCAPRNDNGSQAPRNDNGCFRLFYDLITNSSASMSSPFFALSPRPIPFFYRENTPLLP